jgi:DNA-binding response OmpR family regulator
MDYQAGSRVANILLVEDDDDLAELIQMHIKFQGHQTVRASHCAEALTCYQQHSFDLVVLDRGLPDGDGLDICYQLRQQDDWVPVLVLTARGSEMEKVEGLEAGVDDYIAKPFSVLEFQARVRNILRRRNAAPKTDSDTQPQTQNSIHFGTLVIMPDLHRVSLNDQDVPLTATEFSVLAFLANRPGRVYSKDELLQHVWHTDHVGYHHTVCSTINRLRTKLAQPDEAAQFIQTVWGVGYKFQPQL